MEDKDRRKKVIKLEKKIIRVQEELDALQEKLDELRAHCRHPVKQPNDLCGVCGKYIDPTPPVFPIPPF